MTRLAAVVSAGLVALALAAPAAAQAPENDNYLDSIPINAPNSTLTQNQYFNSQNTTFATVQGDLFSPGSGGGGPEFTTCNNSFGYGKTVWYDFYPHVNGSVRILTTGFDTVVGVVPFAYPGASLPVTSEWYCYDDPSPTTLEEVSFPVTGGRAYTLQIGGYAGPIPYDPANADFGSLEFRFNYFPDRDGDGVLDNVDQCQTTPGSQANGCPPPPPRPDRDGDGVFEDGPDKCVGENARARDANANGCLDLDKFSPAWDFDPGPWFRRRGGHNRIFGIVVQVFGVTEVPPGAKVSVKCTRHACKSTSKTANRVGNAYFNGFKGDKWHAGTKVIVRISQRGFVGRWRKYAIKKAAVQVSSQGCLTPGSRKLRKAGKCSPLR